MSSVTSSADADAEGGHTPMCNVAASWTTGQSIWRPDVTGQPHEISYINGR